MKTISVISLFIFLVSCSQNIRVTNGGTVSHALKLKNSSSSSSWGSSGDHNFGTIVSNDTTAYMEVDNDTYDVEVDSTNIGKLFLNDRGRKRTLLLAETTNGVEFSLIEEIPNPFSP